MHITSFFGGVIASLLCIGIIYLLYKWYKHYHKSDDKFSDEDYEDIDNEFDEEDKDTLDKFDEEDCSKIQTDTINGFVIIEDKRLGDSQTYVYTVYDSKTFVMYAIMVYSDYKSAGITISPLYNADSSLRTYQKDAE